MKYIYTIICTFLFASIFSQEDNFVKLGNINGDANESITNIIKEDASSLKLISTGAIDINSLSGWQQISRDFDTETMEVLWKKFYTHTPDFTMSPNDIIKNSDDNYVIVGSTRHKNNFQLNLDAGNGYILEMDIEGNVLWCSVIGEEPVKDWAVRVAQIEDGGYVYTGWKYVEDGSVLTEAVVRAVSTQGDSLWTFTYYTEPEDKVSGIDVVAGGFNSVWALVNVYDPGEARNFLRIFHMDGHTGQVYRDFTYKLGVTMAVYNAFMDQDFNLVCSGHIRYEDQGGCVTPAVWKINSNGDVIFEKDYMDELGCLFGNAYNSTNDGGYIFVTSGTINNTSYPQLVKLDKEFNLEWTKIYDIELFMTPNGVVQMGDGSYIIAGYEGATPEYSIWVLKTDENGDLVSVDDLNSQYRDVKLFPNPTSNYVNISCEACFRDNMSYRLFDLQGVLLKSGKLNERIDLSRVC